MTPFREDRWQLFDVANDINELHDVADEHPDMVSRARRRRGRTPPGPTRCSHSTKAPGSPPRGAAAWTSSPDRHDRSRHPDLGALPLRQLIAQRSSSIVVDWTTPRRPRHPCRPRRPRVRLRALHRGRSARVRVQRVRTDAHAHRPARSDLSVRRRRRHRTAQTNLGHRALGRWPSQGRRDGYVQWSGFLPYEGIDVGIDRRSPVSWSLYERHGAFPYQGALTSVRYVPGDLASDVGEALLEQYRTLGLTLD